MRFGGSCHPAGLATPVIGGGAGGRAGALRQGGPNCVQWLATTQLPRQESGLVDGHKSNSLGQSHATPVLHHSQNTNRNHLQILTRPIAYTHTLGKIR